MTQATVKDKAEAKKKEPGYLSAEMARVAGGADAGMDETVTLSVEAAPYPQARPAPGGAEDDADPDGEDAAAKKRRRVLMEEEQEAARDQEARGDVSGKAKAGFAAAAQGDSSGGPESEMPSFDGAESGGLDLSGKMNLSRSWLKDPRKHLPQINRRMDKLIEQALDNDWKYIAVTHNGKVHPMVAMMLQTRIAHLTLHPKETNRILTGMGYETPEAQMHARQKLEAMVVLHETVDMKKFQKARSSNDAPSAPEGQSSGTGFRGFFS